MGVLALDQVRDGLRGNPTIYPQNLSIARGQFLFLRLQRAEIAAASFLDDRILTPQTDGRWLGFDEVESALQGATMARPLHFIFHAGHVGSTLISRLLDEMGGVLGLREPLPLRVLAEAFDDLGAAHALIGEPQAQAVSRWLCLLWARGYDDTRTVIVKATSSASRLAGRLLDTAAHARALFLNLKAEPYLATLLAGQNSYIDLRGHGPERYRRLARLGAELRKPLYELSLGELAALTWLAETLTQQAAQREHSGRVLTVDFDNFLTEPGAAMQSICAHLGVDAPPGKLTTIADNPVFRRYSKAPETPYSPALRQQILAQARAQHGDQIRRGLVWLEEAARSSPIAAQALSA